MTQTIDPMSLRAGIRRRVKKWLAPDVHKAAPRRDIAACECHGWKGYTFETMYPKSTRISIGPGQSSERLLHGLPRTTRLVALQIDASYTADFWSDTPLTSQRLAERGILTVNVDADDIRKRTVHQHLAKLGLPSAAAPREGPPEEKVIIKTTLNAGGAPERKLIRQWGSAAERMAKDLSTTVRGPLDYRVCRRDAVPEAVWTDASLVVERFIENPEGIFLRVYVMGPASVVCIARATGAIKKMSLPLTERVNIYGWTTANGEYIDIGQSHPLAQQALHVVRPLCTSLHLDLCGTDCMVTSAGEIIPVDVNKTPYWGTPRLSPIVAHLRHGVESLLPT